MRCVTPSAIAAALAGLLALPAGAETPAGKFVKVAEDEVGGCYSVR